MNGPVRGSIWCDSELFDDWVVPSGRRMLGSEVIYPDRRFIASNNNPP